MNKSKLLAFSVVALLLMNLALLAFLVFGQPNSEHPPGKGHHPPGKQVGPMKKIISKLNLDETQQASYQTMIEAHKQSIDEQQAAFREDKNNLFSLLKLDDFSQKDSIIAEMSLTQARIENIHFQHFADLKRLCRPDQLEDFNALTDELAILFSRPQQRKK